MIVITTRLFFVFSFICRYTTVFNHLSNRDTRTHKKRHIVHFIPLPLFYYCLEKLRLHFLSPSKKISLKFTLIPVNPAGAWCIFFFALLIPFFRFVRLALHLRNFLVSSNTEKIYMTFIWPDHTKVQIPTDLFCEFQYICTFVQNCRT